MDRKKLILIVLFLLMATRLAILPISNRIEEKKEKIDEAIKALKFKHTIIARHRAGQKEQDRITNLEELLYPAGRKVTEIQTEMANKIIESAKKRGLKVVSFSFIEGEAVKNLQVPSVSIILQGSVKALVLLLGDLGKRRPLYEVASLTMDTLTKPMTYVLNISAYGLK